MIGAFARISLLQPSNQAQLIGSQLDASCDCIPRTSVCSCLSHPSCRSTVLGSEFSCSTSDTLLPVSFQNLSFLPHCFAVLERAAAWMRWLSAPWPMYCTVLGQSQSLVLGQCAAQPFRSPSCPHLHTGNTHRHQAHCTCRHMTHLAQAQRIASPGYYP